MAVSQKFRMGEAVIYEAIGNKTPRVTQMIMISKAWKWIMSTSEKP